MKRINIALCLLMLLGVLFSCSKASLNYTQNGNWVSRAVFAGVPMGYGASFVINGSAYVGTGFNPADPNHRLTTMYRYDPTTIPPGPTGYDSAYGTWTQVADFIGSGRCFATGFSIGNNGYIGSGTNDGISALSDFYQYTPNGGGGSWTKIDSIHDANRAYPRIDAVSFSFDTVAYVLTGYDFQYYLGDVWKYSPASQTWTKLPNMPGSPRSQAATWVYNKQGYLLTGYTSGGQWTVNGNACYDFWRFDPNASGNQWTRLRDISNTNPGTFDDSYTNIVRYHAAAFTIPGNLTSDKKDKGYITCGQNVSLYTYTWEYDFATDLWTEKTPFEGAARQGAVGFTVQGRGFVATGMAGTGTTGSGFTDCREFFPAQVYNQYD